MKQRLITGIVAAIFFISMLYLGSYWYVATILAMAVVGFFEFVRLHKINQRQWSVWLSFGALCFLILHDVAWQSVGLPNFAALLWLFVFLLLAATVISKNKFPLSHAAILLIGVLYIGFGFHIMLSVRLQGDEGFYWAILLFASIWSADIGAYASGRLWGRHLLWPTISPKKTIEELVGAIVAAALVSLLLTFILPLTLAVWQALLLGGVVAVVGQMGDLIQSAYKRIANVKDSGSIFPGHGGILDRCDSWLIVFPFVSLLFNL